eukprot:Selendium_serpulae@DN3081_c0_g1_i1.p1
MYGNHWPLNTKHMFHLLYTLLFASLCYVGVVVNADAPSLEALGLKYNPKNCKYHPIPSTLDSYGYLKGAEDIYISDVFAIPGSSLIHELRFSGNGTMVITLSAELHRDSAAEFLHANLFEETSQDEALTAATPLLWGEKITGAGGERTKVFFTGVVGAAGDQTQRRTFVIKFSVRESVNVAKEERDQNFGGKSSCLPVRVDLAVLTMGAIQRHIPRLCPSTSRLPDRYLDETVTDEGISRKNVPGKPYVYVFGEENWRPFQKAIWNTMIIAPAR